MAKYKFVYDEPEDYSYALDYSYKSYKIPKYEVLNNVIDLVKQFPYIMYTCKNYDTPTRWSQGVYYEILRYLRYLIKSPDEYNNSGLTIHEFYNL